MTEPYVDIHKKHAQMNRRAVVSALIVVSVILATTIWVLFVPPTDPRAECGELTHEEITVRWQSGDLLQRRSVIECVAGAEWNGSQVGSPDALRDKYGSTGNFIVADSKLAGMNMEEVIDFLGPPSSNRTSSVGYDLGEKPSSVVNRILNIGWGAATRSFWVQFDERSGEVSSLHIGGQ